MIGLQELIIKEDIMLKDLAKYLEVTPSGMKQWFKKQRVPEKYLKALCDKFKVEKSYFNKIVNDEEFNRRKKGFNNYIIDGNIVKIIIKQSNGKIHHAIIDLEDLDKLIKLDYCWHVRYDIHTFTYYVVYTIRDESINTKSKATTVHLHKYILDADVKNDEYIDHINHDTLDNRKENLRITKNKKNLTHRKGANSNNKSGYRNVCWIEKEQCYYVQLQIDGVNTRLKKFRKDEMKKAARYAEKMREKYYGEFKGNG
jgi:hypothetical protein